ncbi:uncharacterized protein BO97DRAFT_79779 [Aspergillus homomorphus CBS 101889]|uniref:Uncharacterized protein n=1 Tax=Aspergillus homomorphus (strain CBS 101889) TaxID=1450537 RepID=A0A395ICU0_ASPHC|nr:hypothetical protein BO97DRAFT_79779 [Aspergillus homomorphus CBS 101889]RAL16948.1 hypothetical protein BO97DRAFT_79779 [Aspergillus homomorphus CBS 101889]
MPGLCSMIQPVICSCVCSAFSVLRRKQLPGLWTSFRVVSCLVFQLSTHGRFVENPSSANEESPGIDGYKKGITAPDRFGSFGFDLCHPRGCGALTLSTPPASFCACEHSDHDGLLDVFCSLIRNPLRRRFREAIDRPLHPSQSVSHYFNHLFNHVVAFVLEAWKLGSISFAHIVS